MGQTVDADGAELPARDQSSLSAEQLRYAQDESNRLSELIVNSQSRSLRVSRLIINGAQYTRPAVVEYLVQPILKSENLGDVIVESREVVGRLRRLGIFKDVSVKLDAGVEGGETLDVVINLEEGPRIYARTGADFSNYDTSTNITAKISNAFGAGETIQGHASYALQPNVALNESAAEFASQTGSYFQLLVSKPLLPAPKFRRPNRADPDAAIEVSAHSTNKNMSLYMSHEEEAKGAAARYKLVDPFRGTHEFTYDLSWRTVHNVAPTASFSIRQDAGDTLKSSIGYTYVKDHRDDPMLPTQGSYIKIKEEVAGLGGDTRFIKGEGESQWAWRLGNGFSIATSLRGGLLLPIFGSRTRVNDRFVLGGPNTLRGFRQSGVGPMDGDDAVGGDAYWASGLSLFTPLPYLVDKPLKGHFFLNAGSVAGLYHARTPRPSDDRHPLLQPSVSTGLGLAVRFSILRLEVNYCLPLVAGLTDKLKRGWGFGVGVEYM
ncbi:hypothetical protein HDU85_007114 [Gaertneriomyces sp. JEL0708]|nr:hypothetical protein HDU85_007114 [Gaertneriomyces sp. JEL0708]